MTAEPKREPNVSGFRASIEKMSEPQAEELIRRIVRVWEAVRRRHHLSEQDAPK